MPPAGATAPVASTPASRSPEEATARPRPQGRRAPAPFPAPGLYRPPFVKAPGVRDLLRMPASFRLPPGALRPVRCRRERLRCIGPLSILPTCERERPTGQTVTGRSHPLATPEAGVTPERMGDPHVRGDGLREDEDAAETGPVWTRAAKGPGRKDNPVGPACLTIVHPMPQFPLEGTSPGCERTRSALTGKRRGAFHMSAYAAGVAARWNTGCSEPAEETRITRQKPGEGRASGGGTEALYAQGRPSVRSLSPLLGIR
jgi:hypothetical protein